MTETTSEIFEKYQVRKNKKQRKAFRDYALSVCERLGFDARVEKGAFGVRNIVVGDIDKAKVVYTAHYDTCVALPFPNFITPKNFWIYLLYQILLVVILILLLFAFGFFIGLILGGIELLTGAEELFSVLTPLVSACIYWLVLVLMFASPANKHTANDNTSGVTLLFDIMRDLPESERENVAFIFFDLEELGLFGSSEFHSKHKKQMKNKLLINFDCVSDGENMLFAVKKKARVYNDLLEKAFPSTDSVKCEVAEKWVFYPSDQVNFKQGVGVAALKKAKKLNLLYMDRIHTKKDTVYREENIEYLKNGAIKLVSLI